MTDLILGLDGGGSKTQFALADRQGKVELFPLAGGINALDNPAWRDNLETALAPLAGVAASIVSACFGMPGYNESVAIDAQYHEALAALVGCPHLVRNDVYMAFDGAFLDQAGVLALAGTGAMTVGRGEDGTYTRAGGWGEAIGDEGGAYWIGREALARATWAIDGRSDEPAFLAGFTEALGLSSAAVQYGLLDWLAALTHPRSGVGELAVIVDRLAVSGDLVANAILEDAAEHLERQVVAAGVAAGLTQPFAWSYAGSVFKSEIFRHNLARRLGEPRAPALPPLGGGLWLAAKAAGWEADASWIKAIAGHLKTTNRQS